MQKLVIVGGKKLKGTIRISGSKNATLPILAASILSKNKVIIQPVGKAYVFTGYNNTIVSIANMNGDVVCWSTSGKSGFKGARQSTPYAAAIVGENAAKEK